MLDEFHDLLTDENKRKKLFYLLCSLSQSHDLFAPSSPYVSMFVSFVHQKISSVKGLVF